MLNNLPTDFFDGIFTLLVISWTVVAGIYANYRRKNRAVAYPGEPVLLAFYTDNKDLSPVKKGKFGDLYFSAFLATKNTALRSDKVNSILYRVELPFATVIHLLGIPKKTGAIQLDPTKGKSIMEKVELEGDYNSFFRLYAEKGMQGNSRYVLDPKAMVFTLDFCQSQNWEIVGNELYFVQAFGTKDPNDPTGLEEDIVTFVSEIRPAIEKPLTDVQKALLTPYGEDRRTKLKCPICSETLKNEESYFSCPKSHGILLKGKQLNAVKKGKLTLPIGNTQLVKNHRELTCPACGKPLSQVAYDGSGTMIDSCANCPYRWLDAGEYKPL